MDRRRFDAPPVRRDRSGRSLGNARRNPAIVAALRSFAVFKIGLTGRCRPGHAGSYRNKNKSVFGLTGIAPRGKSTVLCSNTSAPPSTRGSGPDIRPPSSTSSLSTSSARRAWEAMWSPPRAPRKDEPWIRNKSNEPASTACVACPSQLTPLPSKSQPEIRRLPPRPPARMPTWLLTKRLSVTVRSWPSTRIPAPLPSTTRTRAKLRPLIVTLSPCTTNAAFPTHARSVITTPGPLPTMVSPLGRHKAQS